MKPHDLRWLADALDMPVFEETDAGVRANPAGEAALAAAGRTAAAAETDVSSVVAAAAAVIGVPADAPALREAEAAARAGVRHASVIDTSPEGPVWRVLATPLASGSAHIALALTPAPSAGAARERMVDVAAAVSHEVANAVGAIRGWANLALAHGAPLPSEGSRDGDDGNDGDDGDDGDHDKAARDPSAVSVREALTLIASAARSAEHAARGMLTLARAGVTDDGEARLDLSAFARELLHLLTLTAREAQVTLAVSIAPQLAVQASRAQMFTILFNLVKNAIEASPAGGTVRVDARSEADGIVLTVSDDGVGLDAHAQERLFEPYYTTKATGTGLGLSLVQSAARACGARLDVTSAPGRGTTFRVALARALGPFERDDGDSRVNLKPVAPADAPLEARILVVDDDRALREMLATALSLRGAEVTSVASADEALALDAHFDVALIDMLLEGSRGDELLAQLRQRGRVTAAMLVTGTVQRPRPVSGGEPDDWVRKPFEIPQLVERIRHVLQSARAQRPARASARG